MSSENGVGARANGSRTRDTAVESATPTLVRQSHGGALLTGGVPGNKGGPGRPKEVLRERMRGALDKALNALVAALDNERLASDAKRRLLADPRISELGPEIGAVIEAACDEVLTAKLTARELVMATETLSKYGIGTQAEIEKTENTRYIIRLPARSVSSASDRPTNGIAVAVIAPPRQSSE